jgi:hypothetical protein
MFPALAPLRVVRTWAALRVMSPDGYPIYEQSADGTRRVDRHLPLRRDAAPRRMRWNWRRRSRVARSTSICTRSRPAALDVQKAA